MAPIIINGNVVDLDSGHKANRTFSMATKEGEYALIETRDVLRRDDIRALEGIGATLQECVADNVYLLRYPEENMQQIRGMPFVAKAGEYAKGLKVNSQLQAAARVDPTATKEIYAVLHEDKGEKTPQEAARELADQLDVNINDIHIDGNRLRLSLELEKLKDISKIDLVRTVEEVPERTIRNHLAKQVLNAEVIINDTPYRGAGQTIAVADTGFDKGSISDVHPAFQGRVRKLIPVGRKTKTNDPHGHGTHVCGSILGARVAAAVADQQTEGVAPEAELVLQSLLNDDDELFPPPGAKPFPLKELFVGPHKEHGAYIHSNSWGTVWKDRQPAYGEEGRQIDEAVYENPELLVIFAAGNDGAVWPYPTLGSQAAAKNCLTVGATESSRPSVGGTYLPTKQSPNDTTEISWYSNRGPTLEGRIKPDVVAPGTAILSTKSRDCKKNNAYGVSSDPLWQYSTGTSMATPLVAGCAAVLREALVKNGVPKPSAALLKAMLINGAYAFHHAHSAKEGFGRVNLAHSIILPSKNAGPNATEGFETGPALTDRDEMNTIIVNIPAAKAAVDAASKSSAGVRVNAPGGLGVTLKATLVYTDKPSDKLQNDLNLSVISSDGVRRNGNMGSNADAYDRFNNVEQVMWKGIPPGPAKVVVKARQVLTDQDYALVWRIIDSEE